MSLRALGLLARIGAMAWLGVFAIASSAAAEPACVVSTHALPAATIAGFVRDPGRILRDHPEGGARLIALVRNLVISDAATLPAVIELLSSDGIKKEQKAAIGTGLAHAAKICVRINEAYAARIQEFILLAQDQDVIFAYAAAAGDLTTSSIGLVGTVGAGGRDLGGIGGGRGNLIGVSATLGSAEAGRFVHPLGSTSLGSGTRGSDNKGLEIIPRNRTISNSVSP